MSAFGHGREWDARSPAGPPRPLRPRAPRAVSTLLTGRLVTSDGVEDLCRIRNISANGMLIETRRAISVGETMTVELRTGERLAGRVMWEKSGQLGVQLDAPIDVECVLNASSPRLVPRGGTRPRAPRFSTTCPARMSSMGRSVAATVENLSQSGARLKLARPVPLASPLTLSIAGLPPRQCAVRWNDGAEIGLAFVEMIPFAELSAWLNQGPHDTGAAPR